MRRLAFLTVAAALAWPAEAQQAGVYDLTWSTVDQGGARVSGGVYALDGTIGQADAAAIVSGGVYSVAGGYWPGVQPNGTTTVLFKDGFE